MGAENNGHTPTHARILSVLSDGKPHSYTELLKCLNDDQATAKELGVHICNLRKKLPPSEDIICQLAGYARGYRHVRLLVPADVKA